MATITGTINSVQLVQASPHGRGTRKTYLLGCSWSDQFTGSADIVSLDAVGATIATHTKNGKTNTLQEGMPCQPGLSNTDADVYAGGTFTVSTDVLQFDLVTSTGADLNLLSTKEDVWVLANIEES